MSAVISDLGTVTFHRGVNMLELEANDEITRLLSAFRPRQHIERLVAEMGLTASVGLGRLRISTMHCGAAAGYRFCAGSSNSAYESGGNELPVQDVLRRFLSPGKTFYDIGANVGFFTVLAGKLLGITGNVLAFEPLPRNCAYLRLNCALNNLDQVMCIEAAVGAGTREEVLRLAKYSSGKVLEAAGTPPPDFARRRRVPMVSLDDWIASGHGPIPDLVKIDIEDAERDVLEGMRATLRANHVAVVFTVNGPDVASADARLKACRDVLDDVNYRISLLPEAKCGNSWLVWHALAQVA